MATALISALAEPLDIAVAAPKRPEPRRSLPLPDTMKKAKHLAKMVQSAAMESARALWLAPFPVRQMAVQEYRPPVEGAPLSAEALQDHQFGFRARQYIFVASQFMPHTLAKFFVAYSRLKRIEEAVDRFLQRLSQQVVAPKRYRGLPRCWAQGLAQMEGDRARVGELYKEALRNLFLPQAAQRAMNLLSFDRFLPPELQAIVISYCASAPPVPFVYEATLVANYFSRIKLFAAFVKLGVSVDRADGVTDLVGDAMFMRAQLFNSSSFTWEESLRLSTRPHEIEGEEEVEMKMARRRLLFAKSRAPLNPRSYHEAVFPAVMHDQVISSCACAYCQKKESP